MGLPPGFVLATTYSAQPGAAVRPHQQQFWNSQAPVGRREFRHSLRFCAPEILQFLTGTRPPQWGPGKGDYEHEVLIGAVPGGVLVTLPPRAKSLAARRQRNPPATNATIPSSPPHPSRLRRATFPPGGRLKGSRRRNSPPLRKPAPPCFKRKTLLQYGRRNPNREGERPWNSTAWWPRPRAPSPTAW